MSNYSTEMWKDIQGYEGLYQVSDMGRVKSIKRPWRLTDKILKINKVGQLSLCKDGIIINYQVCRLVLEAFVGPCPEGMECCHFPDRDRNNNRLDNLRWDTRKANHHDKIFHGTGNKGEKHNLAKVTEEQVREIRLLYAAGSYTPSELGVLYNVSRSNIKYIVKRKSWKHI